jgi:hypothetical protein
MWWHHWAVVSHEPAQDLALHPPLLGARDPTGNGVMMSTKEGGSMVMVEDFPPEWTKELTERFAEGCREYDARGGVPTGGTVST